MDNAGDFRVHPYLSLFQFFSHSTFSDALEVKKDALEVKKGAQLMYEDAGDG